MFNECLYIWNIWTLLNLDKYNATLYKIFINEPLAQCAVSYALKGWFKWKTLSGRLRELKKQRKRPIG